INHEFEYHMTQDDFTQAVTAFDNAEPMRAQLYFRALDLNRAGFRLEAHLLIMATWNFARFRYVTRDFDLRGFESTLACLDELLRPLDNCDLMATCDPTADHSDSRSVSPTPHRSPESPWAPTATAPLGVG